MVFSSNFVGVVFARSLHYQFYCWYFHCLPFLLAHIARGKHVGVLLAGLATLAAVEYSFNVFPATAMSSAVLQVRCE